MWLCGFCGKCSEPRQPLKCHTTYRKKQYLLTVGTEIASETPICEECIKRLEQRKLQARYTKPVPKPRNMLNVDGRGQPLKVALSGTHTGRTRISVKDS